MNHPMHIEPEIAAIVEAERWQGEQLNELPPWLVLNENFLVCSMCPTGSNNSYGDVEFLALRLDRASRRQAYRFMLAHRRCGFLRPRKH